MPSSADNEMNTDRNQWLTCIFKYWKKYFKLQLSSCWQYKSPSQCPMQVQNYTGKLFSAVHCAKLNLFLLMSTANSMTSKKQVESKPGRVVITLGARRGMFSFPLIAQSTPSFLHLPPLLLKSEMYLSPRGSRRISVQQPAKLTSTNLRLIWYFVWNRDKRKSWAKWTWIRTYAELLTVNDTANKAANFVIRKLKKLDTFLIKLETCSSHPAHLP